MDTHLKKVRIELFEPRVGFPISFILLILTGANSYFPSLGDYEVTTPQWVYYGLALALYYVGVYVAGYLYKNKKNSQENINYSRIGGNTSRLAESDAAILTLTLISISCFGVNYLSTAAKVSFNILNIEEFRVAFVDNSNVLNTLYNLSAKLVLIFAGMKLMNNLRSGYLTKICFIIAIIILNILLVRGNLFMTLLLLMIIFNYAYKKISLKIILICFVIAVLTFAVIGIIRIHAIADSPLLAELGGMDHVYALYAAHLLDYVQFGPKALAFLMEIIPNQIDYYYGFDTLSPLYNVVSHFLSDKASEERFLPHFIVMGLLGYEQETGQGVAVGMTTHFYVDAGLPGILIGYFLVGYILELLYRRMNQKRNNITIFFYAYFLQAALWGLYAHIFNGISDLLLPILVYIFLKTSKLKINTEISLPQPT